MLGQRLSRQLGLPAGLTDVSHFAITGAAGLRDRVEIFGSFRVDTRIDRDRGPIFGPTDPVFGGLVNDYPYVRTGWSGDNVGDLLVGVKFNLLSESRQQPVAMAVRGIVKLPTGDTASGAGTGKVDSLLDFIVSKEFNEAVELAGTVGGDLARRSGRPGRGEPVGWRDAGAIGAGFPSRAKLRVTTELHGEQRFEQHADGGEPAGVAERRRQPLAAGQRCREPDQGDGRVDLSGAQRLLRRRRRELLVAHGRRLDDPEQRREQELLGPAVPDRLSPGRARLCAAAAPAAAAAAAAPAAAAAAAGAYADGAGGVQSVHGAGGPDLDGDGDADGFDRLRGDLSLDGADGDVRQRDAAADAVDGAGPGRHGAGDGDGDLPDRQPDGDRTRSTSR